MRYTTKELITMFEQKHPELLINKFDKTVEVLMWLYTNNNYKQNLLDHASDIIEAKNYVLTLR